MGRTGVPLGDDERARYLVRLQRCCDEERERIEREGRRVGAMGLESPMDSEPGGSWLSRFPSCFRRREKMDRRYRSLSMGGESDNGEEISDKWRSVLVPLM